MLVGIPSSPQVTSVTPSQDTPVTEVEEHRNTLWIIGGCTGGGVLVLFACIVTIIVCCCIRRSCSKRGQFRYRTLANELHQIQTNI